MYNKVNSNSVANMAKLRHLKINHFRGIESFEQLFLDGNKRTAIIFANHYLITHALGLIVVPSELVDEYKKILVSYYEDENKKEDISNFLKNKCWIKIS